MRPPSYYTSLANSNSYSNRHSNSSQQLRSSFSSSSSSSYVSRTHLPYVPNSTLVAHCFTGVGSSTRPYGQSALGSSGRSYTTSYTSRPASTKSRNPYLTSGSSVSSSTSGYTSSNSLSSRSPYVGSTSSSYTRRTYTPTSSYYKPIRLRERPLLTQISRQINSPTPTSKPSPAETSNQVHSSTRQRKAPEAPAPDGPAIPNSITVTATAADPATSQETSDKDWSSDVARNISRNKYLIKFREFDKRASISPAPDTDATSVQPLEPETKEAITTMRIPKQIEVTAANATDEKPAEKVADCDTSVTLENKPEEVKKAPRKNIKLKLKAQNKSQPTDKQADGASEAPAKLAKKKEDATSSPPTGEKPKVKRVVKTSKTKAKKEAAATSEPNREKRLSDAGERKVLTSKQVEPSERKEPETQNQVVSPSSLQSKLPPSGDSSPGSAGSSVSKRIRFRQYNMDDFNFLTVLGHGGWGFVILAELKEHDACFAVKCIKKITIVEDDDFDSIMIERKMLALGNIHPFICKLFCTFQTEGYLFFVMEYCAGGDLMFHVQREGKFTEARSRFYAAEIICAIRFLHNRHIIYRDLKLDNILLDSAGHIRLVDFGMCQCRTYREEMLPSNFCGTPEYISPEIIKGVPYNHSVDWWSFGVLLYEMAVGKMPFRGNDENELLWNVCYEQIHYPMFLTKELTTLLQSLLEREPSKRMGMATCKAGDIYDQPWFRGVDWPAVEELRVKPPFVPEVTSKRDVQNFDPDFTDSAPELSPVDESTLKRIDQSQFEKFPYTNPNISVFD